MFSVVLLRVDRLKVKRRYEAPNFLSCSESGRTQAAFNAMLGRFLPPSLYVSLRRT
jgi:hypothetical protein